MFPGGKLPGEDFVNSWYPILIALVLGLIFGFRNYMKGGQCSSNVKMKGKTVLVTGANTGIGLQVAKDLLNRGARVIMTSRDMEKGKEALDFVTKTTKSKKAVLMQLDLASFKSVREFAEKFNKEEERLDVIVNNAGVVCYPEKVITEDGHELHFQVNYLGHFLLTNLLLDKMKECEGGRIINTSALAYQLAELNFTDVNCENKEYKAGDSYGLSKLALMLFTRYLSKQLEDNKITVNIVNPGVVNSDAYRHMPFKKSKVVAIGFSPFVWLLMKRPVDGAQSAIQCAVADEEKEVTGKFYVDCKIKEPMEHALHDEAAHQLYQASLVWTGLKPKPVKEDS